MKDVLLVKYGEIAIRGKNRYIVENRLIKTIIRKLSKIGNYWVTKEQGRFVIESLDESMDFDEVIPQVITVLGVVAVCPGVRTDDQGIENLRKIALEHIKTQYPDGGIKYKVDTKRSDKRYPLHSREVSADIGGYILHNMENVTVDVHDYDVKLMVELRNSAYIYSKVIRGYGGLPVGSSGRATVLMSGGIDSPVAAFLTAKRGVEIDTVYFDSPPYTSERAKQKVKDLAERLSDFTCGIKLHVVPFTDVQLEIYNKIQAEKMTIVLKRAMVKCAEKIAEKNGSMALVMGDSIGQVASQTLESINAIDSAANDLPILRPLCGNDKQEIIDIARRIGTYDISIRPYEDCCTIFVAKHPETKPKRHIIENVERKIENLDELIENAVNNTQVFNINIQEN